MADLRAQGSTGMVQPSDPHPLDFDDYRAYLVEWFARRDGRPSRRGFAADVACSPSLLTHVIKGRRPLGPQRARRWAARLGLQGDDARSFEAMVQQCDASDPKARATAADTVNASRRFRRATAARRAAASLFTRWWIPATYELRGLPGFRAEPAWIVDTLRPPITTTQAREALDVLLALGLLGDDADADDPPMLTPHEVFDDEDRVATALLRWHQELDDICRQRLGDTARERRHAGAITFAADEATWAEVKQLTIEYERRVVQRVQRCDAPDRVLQLNVRVFPVTTDNDAPPSPRSISCRERPGLLLGRLDGPACEGAPRLVRGGGAPLSCPMLLLLSFAVATAVAGSPRSPFHLALMEHPEISEASAVPFVAVRDLPWRVYQRYADDPSAYAERCGARHEALADRYHRIRHRSEDGLFVEAILAVPEGFDPTSTYPVVVYNHGNWQEARRFTFCRTGIYEAFTRAGYVVVGPQYRGVHHGEGVDEWGGSDVGDVVAAARIARSLSFTSDRLFFYGASRGGMMTYQALAAGVEPTGAIADCAPVDIALDDNHVLQHLGLEGDALAAAIETRSAARWPERLTTTPLLVTHGARDAGVPVASVQAFAGALASEGASVDLWVFPEAGHCGENYPDDYIGRVQAWMAAQ